MFQKSETDQELPKQTVSCKVRMITSGLQWSIISAPRYLKSLLVQDQRRLLCSNSSVVQLLVLCTKKNTGEHSVVWGGGNQTGTLSLLA